MSFYFLRNVAKEKSKKKEKRMGGLLNRTLGKKYDNHKKKRGKILQIRWNRFDDEEESYKTVKPKDDGGYRYIEANPSV